jgi:hypothetical protein
LTYHQNRRHSSFYHAIVPVTGAVVVSTPQAVALADAKKEYQWIKAINVPVLELLKTWLISQKSFLIINIIFWTRRC